MNVMKWIVNVINECYEWVVNVMNECYKWMLWMNCKCYEMNVMNTSIIITFTTYIFEGRSFTV